MDINFPKNVVSYLKKLVSQVCIKEETADILIPEQESDVGRVISAWAVPVVRTKELRSGAMSASGGVTAWVLYAPADGGNPRTVSAYFPFSVKWSIPVTEQTVTMAVQCQMQSVDARMVGARKILVRSTVACLGEAFVPAEAEFFELPSSLPKDLEILRQHLPLMLPTEISEKQFQIEESLDLAVGIPDVASIVSYQVQPYIRETRVLGEKAVFKGICELHLVYMTPENRLAVWDTEIPFSQFSELVRNYENEEEMRCIPLMSSVDLEISDSNRRIAFNCELTAQCIVLCRQEVEAVADLYSLRQETTPQFSQIPLRTRLDHQSITLSAEVTSALAGSNVADASFLIPFPKVASSGEQAVVVLPVWCNLLYYDDSGTLHGKQLHCNISRNFKLASGCQCRVISNAHSPAQWSTTGGNITVRCNVELTLDAYSDENIQVVSGLHIGQALPRLADRPGFILCTPDPEDTLWSLARNLGSSVEAIQKANNLNGAAPITQLLLIPVL